MYECSSRKFIERNVVIGSLCKRLSSDTEDDQRRRHVQWEWYFSRMAFEKWMKTDEMFSKISK